MKKYNVNNLYFAKCRHCIMDIVMSYYEDNKEIVPRPDYVDYYTILLFKGDKYINIFDRNRNYVDRIYTDSENECYDSDQILELDCLSNYVDTRYQKISNKECELVKNTIEKTKKLKKEYGYKNEN